jgi:hypothetical protein
LVVGQVVAVAVVRRRLVEQVPQVVRSPQGSPQP